MRKSPNLGNYQVSTLLQKHLATRSDSETADVRLAMGSSCNGSTFRLHATSEPRLDSWVKPFRQTQNWKRSRTGAPEHHDFRQLRHQAEPSGVLQHKAGFGMNYPTNKAQLTTIAKDSAYTIRRQRVLTTFMVSIHCSGALGGLA